jgi:hypothetical protein
MTCEKTEETLIVKSNKPTVIGIVMSARSLIASHEGIVKAERALKRLNLTRTAIAKEHQIASWSTVSKFFNYKPVDRSFFQEICHLLDLDWQDIAASPDDSQLDDSNADMTDSEKAAQCDRALLDAVIRNGDRTRKALEPYILPTIRREAFLEKCLQQIELGLSGKPRIVPILGAAGYGKSTILGTLYDELTGDREAAWVALVRCDDLLESALSFPEEVGEKASDRRVTIADLAAQLTVEHGRGVLLLDTLDIVLTKTLVPILRALFAELLEWETTVVFTCRHNDYADFFEPYHESFAGFREQVYDGCKLTPFALEEVTLAARLFARLKTEFPTEESQITFADRLLALCADRVSLTEIVCNPLLLALLCELFAEAQVVPEDLTVSQLYEIYWNWKIAKVRHQQQSRRIGKAKEKLCLFLAERLYCHSGERLRDFLYETSLDLTDETDFIAYTALRSDGIVKEFGNDRIGFFHQTFLEYAIARWWNGTESGETAQFVIRQELQSPSGQVRHYIWPIFRQFFTLLPLNQFEQISNELDRTQLLPFRAIALAAVSRVEPEATRVLFPLLELAQLRQGAFIETLLIALNSAPQRHDSTVWDLLVKLLSTVGQDALNKTLEIAAVAIARHPEAGARFPEALTALMSHPEIEGDREQGYRFLGKFLNEYYREIRLRDRAIERPVLTALKEYYASLGSKVRSLAIDLYLSEGVPSAVKADFLLTILQLPPANNSFFEREKAIALTVELLPDLLATQSTILGESWLTAFEAPLPTESLGVIAAAVGQHAIDNRQWMAEMVTYLLIDPPSRLSKSFNSNCTIALKEIVQAGGGDRLVKYFLSLEVEQILDNRISTLSTILKTLAQVEGDRLTIDEVLAVQLAQWLRPRLISHPVESIRILDGLAVQFPGVKPILTQGLREIFARTKTRQVNQILKKLHCLPAELAPDLEARQNSKEARIALLKLLRDRAQRGDRESLERTIAFCGDRSQDLAKAASWTVLDLGWKNIGIAIESLLPILRDSPIVVVRQNCLKVILEGVNDFGITPTEIAKVLEVMAEEKSPEVLQGMYQLCTAAIWHHPSGERRVEQAIAKAIFKLTRSVLVQAPQMTVDMMANSAWIAFNQMAFLEERSLIPDLLECTHLLWRAIDVRGKIDKTMVTGLLNQLGKYDPQFLEGLVLEAIGEECNSLPLANWQALVVAIAHNQGKFSPLLDRVIDDPHIPLEVKHRIYQIRDL